MHAKETKLYQQAHKHTQMAILRRKTRHRDALRFCLLKLEEVAKTRDKSHATRILIHIYICIQVCMVVYRCVWAVKYNAQGRDDEGRHQSNFRVGGRKRGC